METRKKQPARRRYQEEAVDCNLREAQKGRVFQKLFSVFDLVFVKLFLSWICTVLTVFIDKTQTKLLKIVAEKNTQAWNMTSLQVLLNTGDFTAIKLKKQL